MEMANPVGAYGVIDGTDHHLQQQQAAVDVSTSMRSVSGSSHHGQHHYHSSQHSVASFGSGSVASSATTGGGRRRRRRDEQRTVPITDNDGGGGGLPDGYTFGGSSNTMGSSASSNSSIPVDSTGSGTMTPEDVVDGGEDDPAYLYVLCEMAMPLSDQRGGNSSTTRGGTNTMITAKEAQRRNERMERLWDAIRHWIETHPAKDEQTLAAQYQGAFSTTALHMVCKLPNPPADVVQSLIDCSIETVLWADFNGWLPLHHACANGASGEVLDVLVRAFPEGKVAQDRKGRTPLHFAFFRADVRAGDTSGQQHDSSSFYYYRDCDQDLFSLASAGNIVGLLSDSGAAELRDENDMLPLHYACAYGTSPAVLEVLLDAYPESIIARDAKGRTPLHLAMVNAHRSASPTVVRFLLWPREGLDVVNMSDRNGQLPINSLANVACRLGPDKKEGRSNASSCLQMYLDAKPRANADFLTALQALPEWLRDTAVVSSHVQDILNEKIVKRFPTSILMLDGYMLMVIIICFSVASSEHIDYRFESSSSSSSILEDGSNQQQPKEVEGEEESASLWSGWIVALFIGGTYFLFRELVQMISLWSLGTFRSWLSDTVNWLDISVIVLVFYFSAAMVNEELGSDNTFRTGVAFTKGVLWCAVISFLKSTLVDFAVFVGGVYYVVRRLAAFLLALGVILLAFAQMFLIVYTKTEICDFDAETQCAPGVSTKGAMLCYSEFPHCEFKSSLLKVYTMLMGEVGDETRYSTSNVAQFLYVAFAFLVVILLSNVLIAIVTDSYGVIKNERAAMVFWSNRLDFVAEMDAIMSAKQKITKMLFSSTKGNQGRLTGAPTHVREEPNGEGVALFMDDNQVQDAENHGEGEVFREAWSNVMSLFDASLYDDIDVRIGSCEFWCFFLFRIVAVLFIIPLWLIIGFATAGWLWPPQVREWLFIQKKSTISRADLAKQVQMQINQLKDEIRGLKAELKAEIKHDRREVVNVKTEVEEIQISVMSDLIQVKEIMSTVLDISKNVKRKLDERANETAIAAAQLHA